MFGSVALRVLVCIFVCLTVCVLGLCVCVVVVVSVVLFVYSFVCLFVYILLVCCECLADENRERASMFLIGAEPVLVRLIRERNKNYTLLQLGATIQRRFCNSVCGISNLVTEALGSCHVAMLKCLSQPE